MKRPETKSRLKGVSRAFLVMSLMLAARSIWAQEQRLDTTTVPWSQLSEKPRMLDSIRASGVHYPAMLRSANIAGEVRLDLAVDEDGRPILRPWRIERSSHDLFSNSVRGAAGGWLFTPAMAAGRPVRTEVPVEVLFALPVDRGFPFREISEFTMDSAGIHVVAGWESVPRELTTPRDTADVKWAKLIVLLQLLSMDPNTDTVAKTCVRWSDRPNHALPPAMIRRIWSQYPAVMNADACPRTYFSTAARADSLGRPVRTMPRGHVNPVWVAIGDVQPWTADLYVMQGYVAPAGRSHNYRCEAERDERGRWSATCELRSSTLY